MDNLKSIGLITDMILHKNIGTVEKKNNYIVIKTPNNPSFYWGNLLIYFQNPCEENFTSWISDFKNEFSDNPSIKHITFAWDLSQKEPEISNFIKAGFELDTSIVLTTNNPLKIKYFNKSITIKKIITDENWDEVIEFQIKEIPGGSENKFYGKFIEKQFINFRQMTETGKGNWYGAYLHNIMVSDLGLFWENNIAIFQEIKTTPEFRKKGIAQTLMNYAALNSNCTTFVIQAEGDGPAFNMYKSIGFEIQETISGLCLSDNSKINNLSNVM